MPPGAKKRFNWAFNTSAFHAHNYTFYSYKEPMVQLTFIVSTHILNASKEIAHVVLL